MNNSMSSSQIKNNSALAYIWGKYRVYAATSRKLRSELSNWRFRVLALGITGAVLGTLCQESIRLGIDKADHSWLAPQLSWLAYLFSHTPTVLGVLSAIALALATFFGREIVNPEQERRWIRARSIAEALKAQAYLFLSSVPPYNNANKAELLLTKSEELLETVEELPTMNISDEKKKERLPPITLTVDEYIHKRVNDQIENFYHPRAIEYTQKMKRNKSTGLILGVVATILGAIGSTTGWTAGWIAVISTITASITSYAYANRYQYLIISYQTTADQLERVRALWQVKGKKDADTKERNEFITQCEQVISIENSAWMAEFTKKPQRKKKLSNT